VNNEYLPSSANTNLTDKLTSIQQD